MINKYLVPFIVFILLEPCSSLGQSDWIDDDFPGSLVIDIFEKDNKYIAAVSNGGVSNFDTTINYQLDLFELDLHQPSEPGFLLHELTSLPCEDYYGTMSIKYVQETNKWILVQTAKLSSGVQSYRIMLLDEGFNLISNSIKDTLGRPVSCYLSSFQGNTYLLGSTVSPADLFYLRYDHTNPNNLPLLKSGQTEPTSTFWITSMEIDSQTNDMLVFYYGGIAILDSLFIKKLDLGNNEVHTLTHGSLTQFNSNYFSHGVAYQGNGNNFRYLVLQKYDSEFNILSADTFGIKDQDNYPFITKSLDLKKNEILVGGHLDGPISHINFDHVNKKFYVAKYDLEMNRIWYKEFGGDRAYILHGLKLLDNGESMIYGYITKPEDSKRYAYMMYLDANGEIITSLEIPDSEASSLQIVNPGYDNLVLLNPNGLAGNIFVYSPNGNLICSQNFDTSTVALPMDAYSSGIYPFQIFVGNTLEKVGKWVKN